MIPSFGSMNETFLAKIKQDYPKLRFREGIKFAFRPPRTIILESKDKDEPFWELLTLHEVSHAILGHKNFRMDIERLKMEVEAWEKARELADFYEVTVDEDLIQGELDTYRDWVHQKSRCPVCGLTRFQTPDSRYHCPACESFAIDKK